MADIYTLPQSLTVGGKEIHINTDFRDILQIIGVLTDESDPALCRWEVALALFYDADIPCENEQEAMEKLSDFINYQQQTNGKSPPKLIDWQLDAQEIISDVNKVAGMEIRAVPYCHWWTFLSYFYGIGEGALSTLVSIRRKIAKHEKLDKWEKKYYCENKDKVDFRKRDAEEEAKAKAYWDKWL